MERKNLLGVIGIALIVAFAVSVIGNASIIGNAVSSIKKVLIIQEGKNKNLILME